MYPAPLSTNIVQGRGFHLESWSRAARPCSSQQFWPQLLEWRIPKLRRCNLLLLSLLTLRLLFRSRRRPISQQDNGPLLELKSLLRFSPEAPPLPRLLSVAVAHAVSFAAPGVPVGRVAQRHGAMDEHVGLGLPVHELERREAEAVRPQGVGVDLHSAVLDAPGEREWVGSILALWMRTYLLSLFFGASPHPLKGSKISYLVH